MRQMPFAGAGVRHALHHRVFGAERCGEAIAQRAGLREAFQQGQLLLLVVDQHGGDCRHGHMLEERL